MLNNTRKRSGYTPSFERSHNRLRKIFWAIFFTALFLILGSWLVIGLVVGKVASDPEGTVEKAGEVARSWKDAWEKGYKVEASADSLTTDTLSIE